MIFHRALLVLLGYFSVRCGIGSCASWSEWWTYDGISGPDFWGLVNPDWQLCQNGKHQSPIDVDPRRLLFDPNLTPIHIDRQRVSGTLLNTGHDVRLQMDDPATVYINLTGGPLSYPYRIHEISIHFGRTNNNGSEHLINGQRFPAEIQIFGYNTELYGNMSQAMYSTHGVCALALLAQIGDTPNEEFDMIAQQFKLIRYKGQQTRMRHLVLHDLLPVTDDYITYEGSMTQPGCYETVTWLLFNKPIYISQEHLSIMRELMTGEEATPKVPIAHNFRPEKPINHRPIRTNINFKNTTAGCTAESDIYYQANIFDRS